MRTPRSFSSLLKGQMPHTLQQRLKQLRSQPSTRLKWWKSPGGCLPDPKTLLHDQGESLGWLWPPRAKARLMQSPTTARAPSRRMRSKYPVPRSWRARVGAGFLGDGSGHQQLPGDGPLSDLRGNTVRTLRSHCDVITSTPPKPSKSKKAKTKRDEPKT